MKIMKMALSMCLSIITLSVNGPSAPFKRHRVAEWIKRQDTHIHCLHDTHVRYKNTHSLKVNVREKIFHSNENGKKKKKAGGSNT